MSTKSNKPAGMAKMIFAGKPGRKPRWAALAGRNHPSNDHEADQ